MTTATPVSVPSRLASGVTPHPASPWTPTTLGSASTVRRRLHREPRTYALVIGPDYYLYDHKDEAMEHIRERGFGYIEHFRDRQAAIEWATELAQLWEPNPIGWNFGWRDMESTMSRHVAFEARLEAAGLDTIALLKKDAERKKVRMELGSGSHTGSPAISAAVAGPLSTGSTFRAPEKLLNTPRQAISSMSTPTATTDRPGTSRGIAPDTAVTRRDTPPGGSSRTVAVSTVTPNPTQSSNSTPRAQTFGQPLTVFFPLPKPTSMPLSSALPGASADTSIVIDSSPDSLKKRIDLTWLEDSEDEA